VQEVGVAMEAIFKQINIKTLVVLEVSAVGRLAVKKDTHTFVAVGLLLTVIAAVSVTLEMQVTGLVVLVVVCVLNTKTRRRW